MFHPQQHQCRVVEEIAHVKRGPGALVNRGLSARTRADSPNILEAMGLCDCGQRHLRGATISASRTLTWSRSTSMDTRRLGLWQVGRIAAFRAQETRRVPAFLVASLTHGPTCALNYGP